MSDTQKHNKPNVPNLRFPEFSGEWKKERLLESCDTYDGTHQTPQYTKSGVPFVSVEDVTALREVDRKYISEKAFKRDYKIIPRSGDILMTRIGDIGTSMIIENDAPLAYYVSLALIRPNTINTKYLNSYIASPYFKKELYRRTIHVAFPKKINKEDIGECFISCPNRVEQEKIGNLFELINNRIAIQNKVIEKYESLIKAITDKVVERLLKGQLVVFRELYTQAGEGGTPSTSEHKYYENGSIPFIKIDDLSSKYLTANKDFITELGVQKSTAWIIPENSVIFSNGATIGAISINTYPVCTKQGILGIVPKPGVSTEYLYYLMSSSYFNKQIQRIVTEGTMKTAYLKDINHIKCPLPTIGMQDKIASGLSLISSKIELEKQIRNKYLSTKSHLLQSLFI